MACSFVLALRVIGQLQKGWDESARSASTKNLGVFQTTERILKRQCDTILLRCFWKASVAAKILPQTSAESSRGLRSASHPLSRNFLRVDHDFPLIDTSASLAGWIRHVSTNCISEYNMACRNNYMNIYYTIWAVQPLNLLESPGIPIWIGRNRSQTVFAGWYDGSWLNLKKGEEGRGA